MTMADGPFGDSMAHTAELALVWHPLEALPEAEELLRINRANEEVLLVIASMEEGRAELDEEEPWATELARLEYKVDLLLSLVGQLLAAGAVPLPPLRPVEFNAAGIRWSGGELPAAGALIVVELYLYPALPRPIRLPARVAAADGESAEAAFEGIGEAVTGLLDKYVFRRHRRAVALARAGRKR